MEIDRNFCINAFLMNRTLYPYKKCFSELLPAQTYSENSDRTLVYNSIELESLLEDLVSTACKENKACLALSGGIDSAILARFMPRGSVAYTFKCIVPGVEVVDETERAARYAKECGLEHRIIEIYWDDFENLAPELMKHKGAPIHSIEVQIAKAAMQAKADGFDAMIFGESADVNYGGLDGLLSREYLISEYAERYAYLIPYKAIKTPMVILDPIIQYSQNGMVDVHEFERHQDYCESMGSYTNAMSFAQMGFVAPYSKSFMGVPLDYNKVRNGNSKYWIREVFHRLYPHFEAPKKIPMPRPMNEWMADWDGPKRPEFLPNCQKNLTGDQKWMVWALEKFLDFIDELENK